MSSVSGGGRGPPISGSSSNKPASSSGCDVWGSAAESGDFPSGDWSLDLTPEVRDVGTMPMTPEVEGLLTSDFNIEEVVAGIKMEVGDLSKCLEQDKSSSMISSISDKVDSLRKCLLSLDDGLMKKDLDKMCDSSLFSSLLTSGQSGLGGKGAQLLYHVLKREDHLGGGGFTGLKDGKMMKELLTMVDGGVEEIPKFWGLCALEFILRGGDSGIRKAFLEELDGVAILMRIKDGFSHSVDLQNATDRILITLEELEEGQKELDLVPPPTPTATTTTAGAQFDLSSAKDNDTKSGNDFPTVGIWKPPSAPTPPATPISTTSTSTNNQSQTTTTPTPAVSISVTSVPATTTP